MNLSEEEKFRGLEKRGLGLDSLNCHTSGLATTDWNQIGSPPCPSAPMSDSFGHVLWNQPVGANAQVAAATSTVGKTVSMIWHPSDSLTKDGIFLGTGPEILPLSLSQFPSDAGFTGRAARFSCFSNSVYPFIVPDTSDAIIEDQFEKNGVGRTEILKDRSVLIEQSSNGESPGNEQREKAASEFSEQECSGEGLEQSPNSSRGLGTIKRKRSNQDFENDNKKKVEKNSSTIATVKPLGKSSKESGEAPKEDYIHVRARRGQATNSHSLAERVRREKISERMKFLQDLVPGCSKVTGKAVMLDEIINYVQSLQRQVEFLSMKLAAVNPSLDFNVEGLLSKDLFQTRIGSSSAIGFSTEMMHQHLHSPHQTLMQVGVPGVISPSDSFRKALNFQLPSTSGYKEGAQQMPNTWEDDLHNVVQMTYGNNLPLKTQDLNGGARDGFQL